MHGRRQRCRLLAAATVALTAGGLIGSTGPPSAQAAVTGEGVAEGHNVTVFHNIDMVSAMGWAPGEQITVRVLRNGVPIGTATGPAVNPLGEGAGLEVNHGPVGPPQLGDCWDRTTPDIRPGDVVTTTVTGAAPHHLIADAPISAHRRTRAGDAHAAGRRPRTGVGLGMPGIGAPTQPATSTGCGR